MQQTTLRGGAVFRPALFHMDKRALAWAEQIMLQGGERHQGIFQRGVRRCFHLAFDQFNAGGDFAPVHLDFVILERAGRGPVIRGIRADGMGGAFVRS
jgi:hypothetical protein